MAVNIVYNTVFHRHADHSVRVHAVYGVKFLGFTQQHVALLYGKSQSTFCRWVSRYEDTGDVCRNENTTSRFRKLSHEHKEWIVQFVMSDPLSFLREITAAFNKHFGIDVSATSVFRVLKEYNFSNKVIERRALEISFSDVTRFTYEINLLRPLPDQLLFLDEMSTDNRSMFRKRGWFLQSKRPFFRGLFTRSARISVLTFLGVNGIVENYQTFGTFDRKIFFECVVSLLDKGVVQKFPGRCSVWILDGASIHLDSNIVEYLYSRGIYPIFLPAYCPFYNPIEIVFGIVKRRCRILYKTSGTELMILLKVMTEMSYFDATKIFNLCGYSCFGYFNPHTNYDHFITEADGSNEQ